MKTWLTRVEIEVEDAYKIFMEMGFFLSLLIICEIIRWIAKQGYLKVGQKTVYALWLCTLVLLWYTVSITLILFNKWVIGSWEEGGMKFPIFYTTTHMFLKGCFALGFFVCTRGNTRTLPRMSCRAIIGLSVVGSVTAFDVVTSNLSLLYISASYYTFLKSSALMFYLILALLFRIEPCSIPVISCVCLVSLGMFMTSYGETEFSAIGFTLVMASEVFAAVRWIVTQMMVQDEGVDAMSAVLYMAPASTLSLVPFILARERSEVYDFITGLETNSFGMLGLIAFPGFMAFLLLLTEVQLVRETSGLTLTMFGNLKSVCTIIFAVLVFGETTNPLQWCGLGVAVFGMLAYANAKEPLEASRKEKDGFAKADDPNYADAAESGTRKNGYGSHCH